MIYLLKMVIFHSYVNVYQRVWGETEVSKLQRPRDGHGVLFLRCCFFQLCTRNGTHGMGIFHAMLRHTQETLWVGPPKEVLCPPKKGSDWGKSD